MRSNDSKHSEAAKCPFYRRVVFRDGLHTINCGDSESPRSGIILWWRDEDTREEHFAQYCSEDFALCGTFLAILKEQYPDEYKEFIKK